MASGVQLSKDPGRVDCLAARIRELNASSGVNRGLTLLTAPYSDVSSRLTAITDELFQDVQRIPAIYFEFRESDKSVNSAAFRFANEFVAQLVAFHRREARGIYLSVGLRELTELVPPGDAVWFEHYVESLGRDRVLNDGGIAFRNNAFSGPIRATATGLRCILILDSVDRALDLEDGCQMFEQLSSIYGDSDIALVLAGRRRALYGKTRFEELRVEPMDLEDSASFIEKLSTDNGVLLNAATRDLLGVITDGREQLIRDVVAAARDNRRSLATYADLAQTFADEMIGGRISRRVDREISSASGSSEVRASVVKLLFDALSDPTQAIANRTLGSRADVALVEADHIVTKLHNAEIVRAENGYFRIQKDIWVSSFLKARYALEQEASTRATVLWHTMADLMATAPKIMESLYRERSSIGLRELMSDFRGQHIAREFIDYSTYKHKIKGLNAEETKQVLASDDIDILKLPSITYTAYTSAFYPQIDGVADSERSSVALGFHSDSENRGKPIVWIAAEIDSKFECGRALVEFWCDRLEMVAVTCGFDDFRIWLISPEGFDEESMEILGRRNAFGSSRTQAQMLKEHLAEYEVPDVLEEYEIVVPMSSESEIVAANTLEDVARRHGFDSKTVNQIKTALVEACINATEHGHSPDRKIYQKIGVGPDRIVLSVSNRGVRMNAGLPSTDTNETQRRGWGLKLIQKLMDEVTVQGTDDGTVITMTKLRPST